MDDDITLKRCPFCGSYPIHEDIGGINYYRYHIFCGKCGAAMPYEHIDEIAISRWNSRVKLENEITKTQEQLEKGENTMNKKELENEIPEELTFEVGDRYDYVDSDGGICWDCYHASIDEIDRVSHRRAFLSEEYARIFAEKTQFIADMLHFKYLYDRDYKPDWGNSKKRKWYVCCNEHRYVCDCSLVYHNTPVVYFSSEEIAERCAEWLNKKYGYTKPREERK